MLYLNFLSVSHAHPLQDLLKAQYQKEHDAGATLNPAIWAGGDWTSLYGNTTHPKRFTYALTRGPLQDAPGSNAIWNITNVTRSNKRKHYLDLNGTVYATKSSQDPEVQAAFYDYFPEWNKTGNVEQDIPTICRWRISRAGSGCSAGI